MLSLLKRKKTKIDHEFSVDVTSNEHGIYLDIAWQDEDPEHIALRFSADETRQLIKYLEAELKRHASIFLIGLSAVVEGFLI